jgi:hypothetical protein
MMNQERTLVLEMLAAGKIDVTQADELLESLEPPPQATTQVRVLPAAPERSAALKLTPEQVLELKNHDIDARFIRSVQDAKLNALSFDDILELGVHEVSPKFIREIRENFPDISIEQIIELHNHDIDTSFLRELRDANLLGTNPETLIDLKEAREEDG